MSPADLHEPASSIEALLAPERLARLEGRSVDRVSRQALVTVDGLSGGHIERVVTTGADGDRCYVVKRFSLAGDWIMRATGDEGGRAAMAWRSGLLDRLPPCIDHATIGCAHDGDGWALLMRDISSALVPPGDAPITATQQQHFLTHMATMHAAFWGEARWADPDLGFCTLRQRYLELSPAMAARERDGRDAIPPMVGLGWSLLEEALAPDVAAVVRPLLDDPEPLCQAQGAFPHTVIHGDWKLGNLGLAGDGASSRTVLLDWAVVGVAPPAVDLAWYLAVNAARLPISREETIATFERALREAIGRRFARAWWEPHLALSLLGGFLQLGWPKILGAVRGDGAVQTRERDELRWWSERVSQGARYLPA